MYSTVAEYPKFLFMPFYPDTPGSDHRRTGFILVLFLGLIILLNDEPKSVPTSKAAIQTLHLPIDSKHYLLRLDH